MLRLGSRYLFSVLILFSFAVSLDSAHSDDVKKRVRIKKKSQLIREDVDTSEEFNLEKSDVLSKKRQSLISDIKRFIREARDSAQIGELNLRLGTLYMEDYRAGLAKAQRVFDRESERARKEKSKTQPKFNNSEALSSLDKARAVYADLLKRYPQHPRRDEMLYFMSTAMSERGKQEEAVRLLTELTSQHPRSRYTHDAHIQLADYYFEKNQYPQAEQHYDRIVQGRYQPLLAYSMYKKAWCQYNLQKPAKALEYFKWVIQQEESLEGGGQGSRLKTEAIRDITLPFVELKQTNEAIAFFQGLGEPYTRTGLEAVASLYFDRGDHKLSISLYETLLTMDPNHAHNPRYDLSIIDSLKHTGNFPGALQRLFAKMPVYLDNSNWFEIHSQNSGLAQETKSTFEETARKYAFQLHADAQKTKNDALYNSAKQIYGKYLEFFPKSAHASKIRFYFAEILYKQRQFVPSADQYYIVYKDPSAGKMRTDSIRYALSALDQQVNADRKKAGLTEINSKSTAKLSNKEDESLELVPYSTAESKFIEVSTEYLDKFSTAKDAPDVLYTQAYLMYTHHELPKAYKSFWTLAQKYPKHSTAVPSAYLILDILNRRKEYPKLIAACSRFLETRDLHRGKFVSDVSDVLRKSELKRISQIEEKEEHKEAADAYLEYTQKYGAQDEALYEKALYNASVNYFKAGLPLSATETQEKFLRRFSKSPLRENMLLQVAKAYESMAVLDKAGAYFEQFVTQYPNNAQSKSALRLAGLYYWGSGNSRKAEALLVQFIQQYPRERSLVEKDLLNVYQAQGAKDRELRFLLASRAERGIPLSQYLAYTAQIADLQMKLSGKIQPSLWEEAYKVTQRFASDLAKTPRGVEAMSKFRFMSIEPKERYFYQLKLALPQRQLEANLQKKLALIKELERDFQSLASLGSGEYGLASMYKTALMYRHMADAVLSAPVPAELNAEQMGQYRDELQKQMVNPFKEKSLNLAAQCMDKAQELSINVTWTARCYGLASDLQPERYPKVRTFYLAPFRTALWMPAKDAKFSVGSVKRHPYPFYSSNYFKAEATRGIASIGPGGFSSNTPDLMSSDGPGVSPILMDYRAMGNERQALLKAIVDDNKPDDPKEGYSFAYLNGMRLTAPAKAAALILSTLQKHPNSFALHNLLALSYMEAKNHSAAKVTWLSLLARGARSAHLWNNLGVLASLEGDETEAVYFFNEALKVEPLREAHTNLGFICLKYRNGSEARRHFEKALDIESDDAAAKVGLAVSQLQNRQFDDAKDTLVETAKKRENDPYARLSLSYFLLDIEKEFSITQTALTDYMNRQNMESDPLFRQAMMEVRRLTPAPTTEGEMRETVIEE